jgi:tetratricopeptide (TPR) repeat protein
MTASSGSDEAHRGRFIEGCPISADCQWFVGRVRESAQLATRWLENPVTVLSGPSGTGKTSLICAGVIPLLSTSRADVLPVGGVSHSTVFPLAALPEHNAYTLALLMTWSPGVTETRLVGRSVREHVSRRPPRTHPDGQPIPVLAVIDQMEELFAGAAHADRDRGLFMEDLAEAVREMPELRLLLSIREDFLEDLARHGEIFAVAAQSAFRLDGLTREAVTDALRHGQVAALNFTTGAADRLVAGLADSARDTVDPSLLQALAGAVRAGLGPNAAEVTEESLLALGDADRLLDGFYDGAVAATAVRQRLSAAALGSWLNRTFVTELGTRGTVYEGLTHTAGMPNAIARALRDARLLSAVRRSGARWYELSHERLAGSAARLGQASRGRDAEVPVLSPADSLRAAEAAIADGDLGLGEYHAEHALRTADRTDLRACAEAESVLGNIELARGRPKEAEKRYHAAAVLYETLRDTPAVAGMLAAAGRMLLMQGRYGEAVSQLTAAVGRVPGDPTVQTEFAWALWYAGEQRTAVDILTGVLAVDGDQAGALRARGEILADLGDAEAALRDLDRVRRHERPSSKAARGLALATLRMLSSAAPVIDAALSLAPDSGPVLLYAARAAVLTRDPAVAADLARRAMRATDPAVPPHQRRAALQLLEAVS